MADNKNYKTVLAPKDYPGRVYGNGHCYEHHLVCWRYWGVLPAANGRQVHHKNGNKKDNRIVNLELVTPLEHAARHRKRLPLNAVCSCCKKKFRTAPWKTRKNYSFCSRACVGRFNFYSRKHYADVIDNFRHGTRVGYSYHGCRCDKCKERNREAQRQYRHRQNAR